jgi:GNAT superfamily N-acetyltransferase
MMHFEIAFKDFNKVFPVTKEVYQDPLMFAVLEGARPGRIFVDDRNLPNAVFVWTYTECAYILGAADQDDFYKSIFNLVEAEFIPTMTANGETFISVITFDQEKRQQVLSGFKNRHPLGLMLSTYRFDSQSHLFESAAWTRSFADFELSPIERTVLENPTNHRLAEQIIYYWGSCDTFLENGIGTCLLKEGQGVSWCFSEAFGANTHSLNVVTRREYRRQGFAHGVCKAFIELCLERGTEVAWLCDESNRPAKALAESLGFRDTGYLYPVDIPFYPEIFYTQVADHLSTEFNNPDQAAVLYQIAACLKEAAT